MLLQFYKAAISVMFILHALRYLKGEHSCHLSYSDSYRFKTKEKFLLEAEGDLKKDDKGYGDP